MRKTKREPMMSETSYSSHLTLTFSNNHVSILFPSMTFLELLYTIYVPLVLLSRMLVKPKDTC